MQSSVQELQKSLHEVILDPRLMGHVTKTHELFVQTVYDTAELTNRRKRRRVWAPDPSEEHPEVTIFRRTLEAVRLKSWPLTLQSALFIRPPKQSDHNTLAETKRLAFPYKGSGSPEALIFVTVYDRLTWGHRLLSRSSQHVFLSSHTLEDLFETIPCTSNEITERREQDTSMDCQDSSTGTGLGSIVCMEGTAYGDGRTLSLLMESLQVIPEMNDVEMERGPPMHDATFRSLGIRLHQPYWLCHAGSCEHFLVIEHIRGHESSDPPFADFPLTTQITPTNIHICRACNKVPAVLAIVGDIRLGESPFLICRPCWRWMGLPKGEDAEKIEVVTLPKHAVSCVQ